MAFRRAQKQKPWHYNQGFLFGGADESRTRDLLNAIQTRSQLRHSPANKGNMGRLPKSN
jgi:hypothetical protein